MQLYKRSDSNKYWVSWNDQDGKRIRRNTGVANRKPAEALAAKWVKEGFLEEHFGKKPDVPFEEALLRYAKTHKRDHTRTFERVTRYRLKHFQERFRGDTKPQTERPGLHVQGQAGEKHDDGVQQGT